VLLSLAVAHLPTSYGYLIFENYLNSAELSRNYRGTIKPLVQGSHLIIKNGERN
jgi:hypothetical protein